MSCISMVERLRSLVKTCCWLAIYTLSQNLTSQSLLIFVFTALSGLYLECARLTPLLMSEQCKVHEPKGPKAQDLALGPPVPMCF